MKLSDIKRMIEKGGIPCDMWYMERNELPYAVAGKTGSGEITHADNGMWYTPMQVTVFLVVVPGDEETEYKMDDILNDNNINFTYRMFYVTEDNVCCKVYSFEVEED